MKACVALLLGASLVAPSALGAQPAKPPTLDEILTRLDSNLNHFDTSLPSLFSEERVTSQVKGSPRDQTAVTDSVFRLRRTPHPDGTATFDESREIKTVNGKPATSQTLDGPAMLEGWFEGAQAIVSIKQTACTNYQLQRIKPKRPAQPYVIRFAAVITPRNASGCLLQENSKGLARIDPESMQITHLEITTPHHTIIPGTSYQSAIVGTRVLTFDYAPVLLSGQIFWLPSTIAMRSSTGGGTFHETVWSYSAAYRNYHKLEVTSRILPGSD